MNEPSRPTSREGTITILYHALLSDQTESSISGTTRAGQIPAENENRVASGSRQNPAHFGPERHQTVSAPPHEQNITTAPPQGGVYTNFSRPLTRAGTVADLRGSNDEDRGRTSDLQSQRLGGPAHGLMPPPPLRPSGLMTRAETQPIIRDQESAADMPSTARDTAAQPHGKPERPKRSLAQKLKSLPKTVADRLKRHEQQPSPTVAREVPQGLASTSTFIPPMVRRVNEGNNLIGRIKSRQLTGNDTNILRRPLPEGTTSTAAPPSTKKETPRTEVGAAHGVSPASADPFTSVWDADSPVNSPLASPPIATSTPHSHRQRATRGSPVSPTRNIQAVTRRQDVSGDSAPHDVQDVEDKEDEEDEEDIQGSKGPRRYKRHPAPSPEALDAMTTQFDRVTALMNRTPRPGEPTDSKARLDWAIDMVTTPPRPRLSSSLAAEPGSGSRSAALITMGQTHGAARTITYRPRHPGAFEDDDLDHTENQL